MASEPALSSKLPWIPGESVVNRSHELRAGELLFDRLRASEVRTMGGKAVRKSQNPSEKVGVSDSLDTWSSRAELGISDHMQTPRMGHPAEFCLICAWLCSDIPQFKTARTPKAVVLRKLHGLSSAGKRRQDC